MKSEIRIKLGKPQSVRHVCPTSSHPAVFRLEHGGSHRSVARAAALWLQATWDEAKRDGTGEGCWTGSHRVALSLVVSTEGHDPIEHVIVGELTCSSVVLLSRNLARMERQVYRGWLARESNDVWELMPYAFITYGANPEPGDCTGEGT